MCIVLGGPFSVKVGFQKIKAIRVTNRLTMSVSFITKLTKYSVEIAKKEKGKYSIPRETMICLLKMSTKL